MRWSKLKQRIEGFFSDAVRGRIEVHAARYRKAHDRLGRVWITIDKEEIINMCSTKAWIAHDEAGIESMDKAGGGTDAFWEGWHAAKPTLEDQSVFWQEDFYEAAFGYLNTSIDGALASGSPLVRALCMLDRRLGKQRLAKLRIENEHPLVQRLLRFRLEAEGMDIK